MFERPVTSLCCVVRAGERISDARDLAEPLDAIHQYGFGFCVSLCVRQRSTVRTQGVRILVQRANRLLCQRFYRSVRVVGLDGCSQKHSKTLRVQSGHDWRKHRHGLAPALEFRVQRAGVASPRHSTPVEFDCAGQRDGSLVEGADTAQAQAQRMMHRSSVVPLFEEPTTLLLCLVPCAAAHRAVDVAEIHAHYGSLGLLRRISIFRFGMPGSASLCETTTLIFTSGVAGGSMK